MTAETSERSPANPHAPKMNKPAVCIGCGETITDPYILRVAPDLEWHADCLRCVECSRPLDENCTCFVRAGRTYCKQDYSRLFSGMRKCARCCREFQSSDFVMRAKDKIYHVDCFKCTGCNRLLMTGEEFALRSDGPLCKADHDCIEKNNTSQDGNISDGSSGDGTVYLRKTPTPSGKGSNNNNDSKDSSTESSESNIKSDSAKANGQERRERRSKDSKPTRVRTVLNEKQLHTLRTCYGANPRPDALMKEQLVEMTGLSPRVIRVWFQNKRCKDKKRTILMKQMVESQEKNGRLPPNIQGMPMIASSPVRHEGGIQGNPVEVTTYQQTWDIPKYPPLGPHDLEPSPYPPMGLRYDDTPSAMHPETPFLTPPNSASKESDYGGHFMHGRLELSHCPV